MMFHQYVIPRITIKRIPLNVRNMLFQLECFTTYLGNDVAKNSPLCATLYTRHSIQSTNVVKFSAGKFLEAELQHHNNA